MIESLHIYLTGTRVFARRESGWGWQKKVEQLGEWTWDANAPGSLNFEQLNRSNSWLGRLSGISFYIGSACCKFMTVDLPQQVTDAEELRAIAAAQMHYQLGLSSSEWCVSVDIAATPAKSIVCAIRVEVMNRIKQLSTEKGLRLISLQPYISSIWNQFNQHCKDTAPLALFSIEDDALTVLSAHNGVLASINSFNHANNPSLIERELKRLSTSLQTDDTQHIYIAQSTQMRQHGFATKGVLLNAPLTSSAYLPINFSDLLLTGETGKGI